MSCMKLQEEKAAQINYSPEANNDLTTVVYKGLMKSHSKFRDILTRHLEEEQHLNKMKSNDLI